MLACLLVVSPALAARVPENIEVPVKGRSDSISVATGCGYRLRRLPQGPRIFRKLSNRLHYASQLPRYIPSDIGDSRPYWHQA
jgi:hypothetical protein